LKRSRDVKIFLTPHQTYEDSNAWWSRRQACASWRQHFNAWRYRHRVRQYCARSCDMYSSGARSFPRHTPRLRTSHRQDGFSGSFEPASEGCCAENGSTGRKRPRGNVRNVWFWWLV